MALYAPGADLNPLKRASMVAPGEIVQDSMHRISRLQANASVDLNALMDRSSLLVALMFIIPDGIMNRLFAASIVFGLVAAMAGCHSSTKPYDGPEPAA